MNSMDIEGFIFLEKFITAKVNQEEGKITLTVDQKTITDMLNSEQLVGMFIITDVRHFYQVKLSIKEALGGAGGE